MKDRNQIRQNLNVGLDHVLAAFIEAGCHLPDDVPDATLDSAFRTDPGIREARMAFKAAMEALVDAAPDARPAILTVEEACNNLVADASRLGWRVGLRVGRSVGR